MQSFISLWAQRVRDYVSSCSIYGSDFCSFFGSKHTVVRVNDTLTFDFAEREEFESHHYAFHVSDSEFDAIFARVKEAGLEYSSDPMHSYKGQINNRQGGRGFYFYDPNGHNLELLTRA
jgi:catechol 2,3-dioxygenase-like lactoylglutathione lyase family enzyme